MAMGARTSQSRMNPSASGLEAFWIGASIAPTRVAISTALTGMAHCCISAGVARPIPGSLSRSSRRPEGWAPPEGTFLSIVRLCKGGLMKEAKGKTKNDLLPGTLEMLVLKTLSIEPMHGYGIAQH